MRHFARMTAALLGTTGVALAVGLTGAGTAGIAQAAPVPIGGVAPVPGVTSLSPQVCIIGLNCGCIRGRTCPGDRRRHAVRPPEARLDGAPVVASDAPAVAGDQEGAPGFTPAPVLASP